jgi:hypothetical protein
MGGYIPVDIGRKVGIVEFLAPGPTKWVYREFLCDAYNGDR